MEQFERFALPSGRLFPFKRQIALGLLVLALLDVILTSGSLIGLLSAGVIAGLSFVSLIQGEPVGYVEARDNYLSINSFLVKRRLTYGNMASVDFYAFQGPETPRVAANVLFATLSFGLDRYPMYASRAQPDHGKLLIRLKKTRWIFFPFPPFAIPRKNCELRVENAEGLLHTLRAKLSESTSPAES